MFEDKTNKEYLSKVTDDFFSWYNSFCEETGNVGAILTLGKNDNNILVFKANPDTAKKIYNFIKEVTKWKQ